jgi:predicted regulator of Ras-like GTPase activity (Roadblock/LC7/MglB family)
MNLINRIFGASTVESINLALHSFVAKSAHIHSAVISTTDGFTVSSSVDSVNSGEKLSAMSGSIYALASSVSREISSDSCNMLTLETDSTKIILYAIPDTKPAIILTLISTDKNLLGELLYSAKYCGKLIQPLLKT